MAHMLLPNAASPCSQRMQPAVVARPCAAAWSSHTIKVSSPEPWVRPVKGGVAGFMTLTP